MAKPRDAKTLAARLREDAKIDDAMANGAWSEERCAKDSRWQAADALDGLAEAERERDEATNWTDIVERHGTDQFDDLAEAWLALPAIQRVTNAVVSTFSKWADEGMMQRFRQHQLSMFQMAYVEGCLAGVKAAEAKTEAKLSALQEEVGRLRSLDLSLIETALSHASFALDGVVSDDEEDEGKDGGSATCQWAKKTVDRALKQVRSALARTAGGKDD